nr:MAG: nonstructural polyprotein [Hangzhou dicistro-like virus 6]
MEDALEKVQRHLDGIELRLAFEITYGGRPESAKVLEALTIVADNDHMFYDRGDMSRVCQSVGDRVQGGNCHQAVVAALNHVDRRRERDERQRAAKKERDKAEWRKIPKEVREHMIKAERYKRHQVEGVETQGPNIGKVATTVAAFAVAGAAEAVRRLAKRTSATLVDVDKVFKEIIAASSAMKAKLGRLWVVPIVALMYIFARQGNVAATLAVGAVVAKLVGPKVWAHIKEHFAPRVEHVQTQAGQFDGAAKVFSMVACMSLFGSKYRGDHVSELLKRLSMLPRIQDGAASALEWITKALETTINWVLSTFSEKRIKLLKDSNPILSKWLKDVDEMCKTLTAGAQVTPALVKTLVDLSSTGYGLKEVYRGTPTQRSIQEVILRLETRLMPYQGALQSANNFRAEPACVMLNGRPGIGKTMLIQPMAIALLLASGILPLNSTRDDVSANIWQKGTSEYWNGYTGQACMMMDDCFQKRANPTDTESEFMAMIRMIGTWAMPLNFADLESKGRVYFNSRLIIGTTNLGCIMSEAGIVLNEPQAVLRRITHGYTLNLRSEFATPEGRLDHAKYQIELAGCAGKTGWDAYPWHIWTVSKHDFGSDVTLPEERPMKEFLQEVAADLRRRTESHATGLKNLDEFVGAFSAGMTSVQGGFWRRKAAAAADEIAAGARDVANILQMTHEYATRVAEDGWVLRGFVVFLSTLPLTFAIHVVTRKVCEWILSFLQAMWNVASVPVKAAASVIAAPVKAFNNRGQKPGVQSNVPETIKTKWRRPNSVVAQSGDAQASLNVYNNSYKVTMPDRANDFGQVVFVNSTLALEPSHFSRALKFHLAAGTVSADDKVLFQHVANSQHSFTLSVETYLAQSRLVHVDRDLAFVNFSGVRAHKKIVGSFIREQDVLHIPGRPARIDVYNTNTSRGKHGEHWVQTIPKLDYGVGLNIPEPFGVVKVSKFYKYPALTGNGDCGAPITLMDGAGFSGRITVGVHVAGNVVQRQGFATIVTQELIEGAMKHFGIVNDCFQEDLSQRVKFEPGGELPFTQGGSFLPIGRVEEGPRLNPQTSLFPTPGVYGFLGPSEEKPACLSKVFRDGKMVYPMTNALAGYNSVVTLPSGVIVDQAVHLSFARIFDVTATEPRKILSFEEAVVGIPSMKIRGVPRGTSSGYPYCVEVRDGKKEFFGFGDAIELCSDRCADLEKRVTYILDEAARGNRLAHVFTDCLKDELRSEAKVENVETRLISASPLDYLIAWRRMFMAFISACMRNSVITGMAPGINPFTQWGKVVDFLREKSHVVFDGDFKMFDKMESPSVLGKFVHFINKWYDAHPEHGGGGEVNNRIRIVLWEDLVHSRHIGGLGHDQTYIYQWNKSLPSGHPMTTIVNSIYSLFCLIYAYIDTTGDFVGFWDNVRAVTYGDDNVVGPSAEVSSRFNQVTVAASLLKGLGLVYTPGRKDGVWKEVMPIEEATFLKRGFREEGAKWFAPLDIKSILHMTYWSKNKKHIARDLAQKFEMTLMELSIHDDGTWDKYSPKIFEMMTKCGMAPRVNPTLACYRHLAVSDEDAWY